MCLAKVHNGASLRRPLKDAEPGDWSYPAFAEGSNSRASSAGVRPVRTSSTIRLRYSGGYRFPVLGIVNLLSLTSPSVEVSTKLGQLQRVRFLPSLTWAEVHAVAARLRREGVLADLLIDAVLDRLAREPWLRARVTPE